MNNNLYPSTPGTLLYDGKRKQNKNVVKISTTECRLLITGANFKILKS